MFLNPTLRVFVKSLNDEKEFVELEIDMSHLVDAHIKTYFNKKMSEKYLEKPLCPIIEIHAFGEKCISIPMFVKELDQRIKC